MAGRERSTSAVVDTFVENSLFFGPRVPEEVKRMIPHLKHMEKLQFRKVLQVIVASLEGLEPEENIIASLSTGKLPEDSISAVFSGLYTLLTSALRLPLKSLKAEQFKANLTEIRIPPEFIPDISSVVFGEKRQQLEKRALENRCRLPKLDALRWRVDVAISTSALNRSLEPSIMMETKLSNGETHTFEVPVTKFHQLRYNVAYVLKEMEDVEKKNILKIQD
ncbi:predicted protein [Nematostella vectensis]|uniref:COMM domain-containing protein 5 n=1 Tax=Nematostella vectensis TaxID=45351 RepID=A7S655_NEMVE|nr:COMM domain-containing protein 5 [Nematostella vectensis]EDO40800.1 predicted protein [Nematostella vectensis]|eukprot:XP_001632863.1 predicted protein [Nematostella vectensis]